MVLVRCWRSWLRDHTSLRLSILLGLPDQHHRLAHGVWRRHSLHFQRYRFQLCEVKLGIGHFLLRRLQCLYCLGACIYRLLHVFCLHEILFVLFVAFFGGLFDLLLESCDVLSKRSDVCVELLDRCLHVRDVDVQNLDLLCRFVNRVLLEFSLVFAEARILLVLRCLFRAFFFDSRLKILKKANDLFYGRNIVHHFVRFLAQLARGNAD
mmetsp:Transcript_39014/g.61801  ORF Transcript_39014/g.61801 Transcript_39014/m.61801 type:complete len:209 (+) Transcript_39014:1573-2199(+)